jgi:hypothetical protein
MRPPMKGENTLERRCEGHDTSPVQNASEPMWWLDMSGQMHVYSQWSGYDEYEDKCRLTLMDIAPMLKINELEDICHGQ